MHKASSRENQARKRPHLKRERGDESLGPASGSHPLSCNSFIIVQSVNKIPTG